MSKSFEDLLAKVAKCSKKTVSVACAQDKPVLEAVKAAKEKVLQMRSLLVMKLRSERSLLNLI